ncbi:MAG: hypothetical protein HQL01_07060 [Nitrospirae bacterium]|nr:hypothetical protein [Nitrospirota bacterium]
MSAETQQASAPLDYQTLLEIITDEKGKPIDKWEITALLETNGYRDVDAATDYKVPDLFALAELLYVYINSPAYKPKEIKVEKSNIVIRVVKNYLKGMLFAVPMIIQIVSMTIVGFGIWSSIDFTLRDATVIAFATLLALALTGGITQIIGRKGMFYLKMDENILAANITRTLYLVGLLQLLILSVAFVIINLFAKLFPSDMFMLFIAYFVLLSVFFTALAIFYMLEAYFTISLIVFSGLVFVYIFYLVLGFSIFVSQYLSLIFAIVIANAASFYRMAKLKRESKSEGFALPRPAALVYTIYPYFIYGSFYFAFIVMDRLLAWTTGDHYLPYFVWFNYPYEVGLDWALIPLIFTIALEEVFIYELGVFAYRKINEFKSLEVAYFNNHFKRVYYIAALTFLLMGILSVIFAYYIPFIFSYNEGFFKFLSVFFNKIHILVFFLASTGYIFLSWALLNCIIFFAYSRPDFAIKSIIFGTLTNFLVGMVASRAFSYYYAVLGLTIGGFVFAAVSTYYGLRFFKRYDYYYYSAY